MESYHLNFDHQHLASGCWESKPNDRTRSVTGPLLLMLLHRMLSEEKGEV